MNSSSYQTTFEAKFDGAIQYKFNADSTYILGFQKSQSTPKKPIKTLHYAVYDTKKGKIIKEDFLDKASIAFHSDHEIKIMRIPGVMRADQTDDDFTYLINLRSGEQYPLKKK